MPLFQFVAHANLGDDFLGVEREVAVHHPGVVAGFLAEDVGDAAALVLAESEDLLALVVVENPSGVVGRFGTARVGGQRIDVVFEVVVAVELRLEHFVCRPRVGFGRVGVFEFLVAVEAVGRHKGALLFLVEDVLHVDELAALEIHVDARTHELLDKHRQVEAVGVEASEVAALHELFERLGDLRECRGVSHVGVRDAVDGRRLGRNRHLGVDLPGLDDLLAVGHDFDHRNLDDAVFRGVDARGLQVEEDDRALEFQLGDFFVVATGGISGASTDDIVVKLNGVAGVSDITNLLA